MKQASAAATQPARTVQSGAGAATPGIHNENDAELAKLMNV